MVTESQKKATQKYADKHASVYAFKAYDTKDADLIAWMGKQESASAYLRKLVREDMERNSKPE